MIEVTKHGKYYKEIACKCESCGCEFICHRNDCGWHDFFNCMTVECPECHDLVLLGGLFDQ